MPNEAYAPSVEEVNKAEEMAAETSFTVPNEERQKMKDEKRRSPGIIQVIENGKIEMKKPNEVIGSMEKDGVSITLTAGNAEHIYAMHLSPDAPPGSKFEGVKSLNQLTDTIKEHFDFKEIGKALEGGVGPLQEKKFVGTVDIGEKMKTGVATLEEAAAKLGIAEEEIAEYKKLIPQIIALNRTGSEDEKKAFIASSAAAHPNSRVFLSQRFPTAPITPFFDGDSIDTTELAVVIAEGTLVTTMPGHHREKLPFSPKGVWEHANDAEKKKLVEQFGTEEEALKRIDEDFAINVKDWTEAGFISKRSLEVELARSGGGGVELKVPMNDFETTLPVSFMQHAEEGVPASKLPSAIHLLEKKWVKKSDELHVTWVSFKGIQGIGAKIRETEPALSKGASEKKAKELLEGILKEIPASELRVRPTGEIRHLQRETDESLIAMCELYEQSKKTFEALSAAVKEKTGYALELPPAHVTLYTLENGKTIGVDSDQQLTERSVGTVTL